MFYISLSNRNETLPIIKKKDLSKKSDIFAVHEIRSYIYVCVCVCAFISSVLRYDEYLVKHNEIVHKIMSDSK